jgi:hypothetical protein
LIGRLAPFFCLEIENCRSKEFLRVEHRRIRGHSNICDQREKLPYHGVKSEPGQRVRARCALASVSRRAVRVALGEPYAKRIKPKGFGRCRQFSEWVHTDSSSMRVIEMNRRTSMWKETTRSVNSGWLR